MSLGATGFDRPARAARGSPPWPRGVQSWSVNAEMARDMVGTLRRLAAIGYTHVEPAGLHGRTPVNFRRAVIAAGPRCDSAHISMIDLHADPARRIGEARDSGAKLLVCSSPMPPRPLTTGLDWSAGMAVAACWTGARSSPPHAVPVSAAPMWSRRGPYARPVFESLRISFDAMRRFVAG